MLDVSNRASIFVLENLPHKNPQRKVPYSEDSEMLNGAWEYVGMQDLPPNAEDSFEVVCEV
jgi:hypothetical protein